MIKVSQTQGCLSCNGEGEFHHEEQIPENF
jgi:hypothetical protein